MKGYGRVQAHWSHSYGVQITALALRLLFSSSKKYHFFTDYLLVHTNIICIMQIQKTKFCQSVPLATRKRNA